MELQREKNIVEVERQRREEELVRVLTMQEERAKERALQEKLAEDAMTQRKAGKEANKIAMAEVRARQMTVEEREEIEAFCAKGLSLAGYPVSYRGDSRRLSAFELRKHQLTDVAQLIRRDAKNRGWRTAIRGRLTHYFRLNW